MPAGYVKTFRAISIHAPLTGSDELGERPCPRYMEFQSTLPSQGATITELGYMDSLQNFNPRSPHRERRRLVARLNFRRFISIHAPLTGSDYRSCSYWICSSYFNPRSPHRERLLIHWVMCLVRLFQSTLSSQGATQSGIRSVQIKEISIHAPLTGSDQVVATDGALVRISIHAPLTGSDRFTGGYS